MRIIKNIKRRYNLKRQTIYFQLKRFLLLSLPSVVPFLHRYQSSYYFSLPSACIPCLPIYRGSHRDQPVPISSSLFFYVHPKLFVVFCVFISFTPSLLIIIFPRPLQNKRTSKTPSTFQLISVHIKRRVFLIRTTKSLRHVPLVCPLEMLNDIDPPTFIITTS